ncbi:MAG: N-acetylmuramoyl-L-alanine amidase [Eubacterium sp.]|nr:N-acetylmuramoyl-L-alanine amidase [Eubacterium sp.]
MLKLKKVLASILCAGMVVTGLGEYGVVFAGEETAEETGEAVTYLVVNTPAVEYGEAEEILVGTGEDLEVAEAELVFENTEINQEYEMTQATISESSVLFSYAYEDENMQGEYRVSGIEFTMKDGQSEYYSMDDLAIEAVFGLGVAVLSEPDAYAEDEETAEAIENTEIVATDEEGEVLSEEDLTEALTTAAASTTVQSVARASSANKIVVLDPGHDSTHCGTHVNSLAEETLVLKIAQYCKAELETYKGVTVYMTRTTSACPYSGTTSSQDNAKRVDYANSVNADIYVSLHLNSAASSSASGAEVYYPNSNGENSTQKAAGTNGSKLASAIQDELVSVGLADRGTKIRNSESGDSFSDGSLMDYYGVIRRAKTYGIPAVIVEHCYQSSTSDASTYLTTNAGLKKLGVADATGIATYLGLSKSSSGSSISYVQSKSTSKLKVAWTKTSDATGYYVYRSTSKSGSYSKVKSVTSGSKLTYTDSNVTSGKTYYYKVQAYNSSKKYSKSAAVAGTVLSKVTLSSAKSTKTGSITLKWAKISGVTGYKIYQSTDNKTFSKVKTVKGASTVTASVSVSSGVKYYYKIRAYKKNGSVKDYGAYSSVKSAISLAKTKATLTTSTASALTISWKKIAGCKGYIIYRSTKSSSGYKKIAKVTSASTLTYKDSSVSADTTYYYKVKAYKKYSGGTNKATASKCVSGKTSSVISITKTQAKSSKKMKLTWSKVSNATKYEVYRSTSASGTYKKLATVSKSKVSYIDKTATAGTTYYYKVRAKLSSGYTSYSGVKAAKTVAAPVIKKVYGTSTTKIKIKWGKVTGASGYKIYRSTKSSSGFKQIATVSGGSNLSYKDTGLTAAKTYYYKVKACVVNNSVTGYSSASKAQGTATYTNSTSLTVAKSASGAKVSLTWKSLSTAQGYYVYRSTAKSSGYTKVATVSGKSTVTYKDTTTSGGKTYYYKIRPYKTGYNAKSSGKMSSAVAVEVLKKATISKVQRVAKGTTITWKSVTGADGYKLYYSTNGSKYTKLATITSGTSYTDTKTYSGDEIYYRVRAYASQTGAKGYGSYGKVGGYKIMLNSTSDAQNVTVAQMVSFYNASGVTYPASTYKSKGAATIEEFCQIVYDEASTEGVKAEVLFAQICLETGCLKFGGMVKASQCNFGGLGATDGSDGSSTATFSSVTEGVRAQVQHLKAYASYSGDTLENTCVDTRYNYVTKGISPYIETLSIPNNPYGVGWASDSAYGTKLKANITSIKAQ